MIFTGEQDAKVKKMIAAKINTFEVVFILRSRMDWFPLWKKEAQHGVE